MGIMQSSSGQKVQQKQVQTQIVEQNYANNTMIMTLSTLQSICLKILWKQNTSGKKKYSQQDKKDYSTKSMVELQSQFKTHLFLFSVSKQQMEKDFKDSNGFIFPKNLPKAKILKEIQNFKIICSKGDKNLIKLCDDFISIINGNYKNLNFTTMQEKLGYNEAQKIKHKANLMKDGINATMIMNELREEVLKGGVKNPQDLEVKIKTSSVSYEEQAKNILGN